MCGACRLQVGDEIKFACVDGPEFDGHLVDFDQAMKRQQTYKTEEGRAMLAALEGDTHHGGCGNCNLKLTVTINRWKRGIYNGCYEESSCKGTGSRCKKQEF